MVDTCTRVIPGMSLCVAHAALMLAKGTAAQAGGIQPTLLPAASQRRALRSRPLCSASGAPAAAEAGAELGTALAAPHETGMCSSWGCSSPSPPFRSAHKTQSEPWLLTGVWVKPGEGVSVEPFSVQSMRWTRLRNRRDLALPVCAPMATAVLAGLHSEAQNNPCQLVLPAVSMLVTSRGHRSEPLGPAAVAGDTGDTGDRRLCSCCPSPACLLCRNRLVLPVHSKEWRGFECRSSFRLRLSSS